MEKTVMGKKNVEERLSTKDYMKFLIPSLIGVFLFLFPVIKDGAVNIPLGYLINVFKGDLKPVGMQAIYQEFKKNTPSSKHSSVFKSVCSW